MTHQFADAKSLSKETDAIELSIGINPKNLWRPRPDLNGYCVKSPTSISIYLIDEGIRRGIPNPDTFNNLFRDWNRIIVDINIVEIPEGAPIPNGAVLIRAAGGIAIYLTDTNTKRPITSPGAMDKYNFNWDRVYTLPPHVVEMMPNGPSISE